MVHIFGSSESGCHDVFICGGLESSCHDVFICLFNEEEEVCFV